jgi:hypothetical protein
MSSDFFDKLLGTHKQPTYKVVNLKTGEELNPEEYVVIEVKKALEDQSKGIISVLGPLQRSVARIEAQQPVAHFEEHIQELADITQRLEAAAKLTSKELSKKEQIELFNHYTILHDMNRAIMSDYRRLRPMWEKYQELEREKAKDVLGERINFSRDDVWEDREELKKFYIDLLKGLELSLHKAWKPTIKALVAYTVWLEALVWDRKALDPEFRKDLDKKRYNAHMGELPEMEANSDDSMAGL